MIILMRNVVLVEVIISDENDGDETKAVDDDDSDEAEW